MEKKSFIFVVIIAVFIMITSISYAFFTDSLSINGVATTVDFYAGDALPTNPVILDTSNNRYFTRDLGKDYLNFRSESWVDNNYTLTYKKATGIVGTGVTSINYYLAFTNPTELEYTNCTATSEIVQNGMYYISDHSVGIKGPNSSIPVNLKPGERLDITYLVDFHFDSALGTQKLKATISCDLQGKRRYFYFNIEYLPWNA